MSNEGKRHRVWDVMEGQMENFSDRGVEKPMRSLSDQTGGAAPRAILNGAADDNPACWVCGKTRGEHNNNKFCKQKVDATIKKNGDKK
eukprot:13129523-Heterocapsa_arctica.AAC.1